MTTDQNDWITDNKAGDPEELPIVLGYKILIRPQMVGGETKGGLLMTEKSRDDLQSVTTVGKVLSMGSDAYDNKKEPWCKVGDYVTYQRFAGARCYHKGYKLLILNDDEVVTRVEDPNDIDPNFEILYDV